MRALRPCARSRTREPRRGLSSLPKLRRFAGTQRTGDLDPLRCPPRRDKEESETILRIGRRNKAVPAPELHHQLLALVPELVDPGGARACGYSGADGAIGGLARSLWRVLRGAFCSDCRLEPGGASAPWRAERSIRRHESGLQTEWLSRPRWESEEESETESSVVLRFLATRTETLIRKTQYSSRSE